MLVFSKDGVELGRVKAVDERNFKIDAQFVYDYWVDRRYIEKLGDDFVMLALTDEQVRERRHATSDASEPLLSPDDTRLFDTLDTTRPDD
jgi:hypothetical protein